MKKHIKLGIVSLGLLFTVACYAHTHVIGTGPSTGVSYSERQYFILWGLIPLNDVNSKMMVDGAENYAIETQQSGADVLITFGANIIIPTTISSRTVTVTK